MSLHFGNYEIGEIYFSNASREVYPIGSIHFNDNLLFIDENEPLPPIDEPTAVNTYVKEENKIQVTNIVTSTTETYLSLFTFRSEIVDSDVVELNSMRLWFHNPTLNIYSTENYQWKNMYIIEFYDTDGNQLTEENIKKLDLNHMVIAGKPLSCNLTTRELRADVMGDNMNIGACKVGDDDFYSVKFNFEGVTLKKECIYGFVIKDVYNIIEKDDNTYLFINPNVISQTALEKNFNGSNIFDSNQGDTIRIYPSWFYDESGNINPWVTEEQMQPYKGNFITNKPVIRALFEFDSGYEWCYPIGRFMNDVVKNNA